LVARVERLRPPRLGSATTGGRRHINPRLGISCVVITTVAIRSANGTTGVQ
jgi:hypothetical protein